MRFPFFFFFGVIWTENICCVFRVKTPFFNFSGVVWTRFQILQEKFHQSNYKAKKQKTNKKKIVKDSIWILNSVRAAAFIFAKLVEK